MLFIFAGLVLILVLAGAIAVYAAYPDRGQDIPHAEWLSDAVTRSNDKVNATLTQLDDALTAKVKERSRH